MPVRSVLLVLASSESFAGRTRAGYHGLEQVKRPLEEGCQLLDQDRPSRDQAPPFVLQPVSGQPPPNAGRALDDANQWGLHAQQRVGWQPSRFLADRAEAKRDFALAERLGSISATAAELGTSWPLLRRSLGTVR